MFYVYSTATMSAYYTIYDTSTARDLPIVKSRILINGGHGLANKHFITPKGVMTAVSDEDMEILLNNDSFQKHMKDGFITYDKKAVDTAKKSC